MRQKEKRRKMGAFRRWFKGYYNSPCIAADEKQSMVDAWQAALEWAKPIWSCDCRAMEQIEWELEG